ncbi:MAG: Rne/Rng family ribonuclease [Elusimicrobia bacterium]|nr:Rne/Rng family ribonuclease [Elusimicrobiota bacterium]
MSNDNDQIQKNDAPIETPARVEPVRVHDDSTPGPVTAPAAQPQVPVAEAPVPAAPTPAPAPVSAPSREDLYPRADGPVEADRDIPQVSEASEGSDADDDAEGDEDEGPEVSVEIPLTGTGSVAPQAPAAEGGAPAAPAVPGAPNPQGGEPREGGRRRRRRRRGGRGGDRNGQNPQNGQTGAAPQAPGAPGQTGSSPSAPNANPQERRDQPQGGGRDRHERHGQDQRRDQGRRDQPGRRDEADRTSGRAFGGRDGGRGDGGRGRGEGRGGDRHRDERRDERRDRGMERTNAGKSTRGPVRREVLANTSFEETRIAILENGRLAELHWERKSSQNIVGNIYKGTVENVLPGISSAFVNIGFEKNAYLYISDVLGDKNAPIDQTLKKGQTVMVQVAKEAISTKGPKVTMDVSLPGRYLVFTPYQEYVGISKHIAEPEERLRLEKIVDKLVKEHLGGKGVVVRTEAEGATEEELEREVKYLQNLWASVQKKYEEQPSPAILHNDLGLAMQIARDVLSDQVYVYLLDSRESQKQVIDFVEGFAPELKDRIKLYEAKTPIFKAFNIEKQIETIRETKVSLPNGGSIVIQEAESLCAIDVNTGRFTGSKSQEETVTATNIEAATLVANQIRLRNIGGIIVVDFIDMRKASNRAKVMEAFADACRGDRAKIRILPITRLGLIELTRERKRMSTAALLTTECPQCRASGRVLSVETLRIKIQREIFEMTGGRPGGSIKVSLHPSVADSFRSQQPIIEKNVQRAVRIQSDPNLMWEDYHIVLE